VALRSYFRNAAPSGILIESWAGSEFAAGVPPRGLRTKTVTTDTRLMGTTVIESICPGAKTVPSVGDVIRSWAERCCAVQANAAITHATSKTILFLVMPNNPELFNCFPHVSFSSSTGNFSGVSRTFRKIMPRANDTPVCHMTNSANRLLGGP
jgi:hypothetical protein